jgi:hypothetical protein
MTPVEIDALIYKHTGIGPNFPDELAELRKLVKGALLHTAADETPVCEECGDGIMEHDPGVCGCCYHTKYKAGSASADKQGAAT